jgi:hypothetical protein
MERLRFNVPALSGPFPVCRVRAVRADTQIWRFDGPDLRPSD